MRKSNPILLITIGTLLFGCKIASAQNFNEKKVKEMLRNFYTAYIKANSISDSKEMDSINNKFYVNYRKANSGNKIDSAEMEKSFWNFIKENAVLRRKKSDSVVKKYCTTKLVNDIKKRFSEPPRPEDNGDVFLKGNMIDMTMLEDLSIRKDSKASNQYYVTYGNGQVTIKLLIVKEKDGYKMDHVYN